MRIMWEFPVQKLKIIADADAQGFGRQSGQESIIISFAPPDSIAIMIESQPRYEDQVKIRHVCRIQAGFRRRLRDAKGARVEKGCRRRLIR